MASDKHLDKNLRFDRMPCFFFFLLCLHNHVPQGGLSTADELVCGVFKAKMRISCIYPTESGKKWRKALNLIDKIDLISFNFGQVFCTPPLSEFNQASEASPSSTWREEFRSISCFTDMRSGQELDRVECFVVIVFCLPLQWSVFWPFRRLSSRKTRSRPSRRQQQPPEDLSNSWPSPAMVVNLWNLFHVQSSTIQTGFALASKALIGSHYFTEP